MSHAIKVGDDVVLALSRPLDGLKARVLRKSKSTGGFTVRLLETSPDAPAYVVGTELHVHGYEIRRP